jgi:hypothetical protein
LLVRKADGKGTESSVGRDAADTTLTHLRQRHNLSLPPQGFEEDFRKDWFEVLCLDFVARLRTETPTFNMFVASQLAALQTERPGIPDSALKELGTILNNALPRIEAKVDRMLDAVGRIEMSISDIANRPRFDGPSPHRSQPTCPLGVNCRRS